TRFSRDWSSDVCSSDLDQLFILSQGPDQQPHDVGVDQPIDDCQAGAAALSGEGWRGSVVEAELGGGGFGQLAAGGPLAEVDLARPGGRRAGMAFRLRRL